MKNIRKIGIWMDHESAQLFEFPSNNAEPQVIGSAFNHAVKEASVNKSEGLMHHKEQHREAEYYHALGNAISKYQHVLLFGPTEAKTVLFNMLKADRHFSDIKIDVDPADKMTDNQKTAFVNDFFTK